MKRTLTVLGGDLDLHVQMHTYMYMYVYNVYYNMESNYRWSVTVRTVKINVPLANNSF